MSPIDLAIESLKRHEGFRASAYPDTMGYLTIGYGTCVDVRKGVGITVKEGELLLRNRVMIAVSLLSGQDFWPTLSDERQAVLIDMALNIGFIGLMKFTKMIEALRSKDYATAAAEMLSSKWSAQLPTRSRELAQIMGGYGPSAGDVTAAHFGESD